MACGTDTDSTGSITAQLKSLTRSDGVSPETVYFSAQGSLDTTCVDFGGGNDMEACRTGQYLGYHFAFDDPDSGTFATTGNSKNSQVSGSPRAIHTFVCDGPGNSRWNAEHGRCEYAVKVRAQNPAGQHHDACTQINIQPQQFAYDNNHTYCVSNAGNFNGCPASVPVANHLSDSPQKGQYSGKRILYQADSSETYAKACIGYDEKNVRIGRYGSGKAPVIESLLVGVDSGCNDQSPDTATALSYPALAKDTNGHVTQGWAYDIAASDLRLGSIDVGMSATLVTLHNLDLDWFEGGLYSGGVGIASAGHWCGAKNPSLNCSAVPYPYGIFLSEVVSRGNPSNLPIINLSCVANCGLVNGGMVGSKARTAVEHNSRFMGAWGLVVSNAWHQGDHLIEGDHPKSKLTLRQLESGTESSQIVDPENFINGNHDRNGPGWVREEDVARQFSPHYNFVIDSKFGDTVQDPNSKESGYIVIWSGHQYVGLFNNTFLGHPGLSTSSFQVGAGGRNFVSAGNLYNDTNVTCRYYGDGSDTPTYYHDENKIYLDAPDGKCNSQPRTLPIPDAPGTD